MARVAADPSPSRRPVAPVPGSPGQHNAITDVPGVLVGQVQLAARPYLTGVTVVYLPEMSVTGVDQRGGAPATHETDLLSPLNSNPGVNAIQLGGSSLYGLSAVSGIVRWLEERGEGVNLGPVGVAPIVPAADIFDLGRGGDIKARTSPEWGWLAAAAASDGPVRQGNVGGGTGALAGDLKGGVGTASVYLGSDVYVGAIVLVNSYGSVVDPARGTLLGAGLGLGVEFAGLKPPTAAERRPAASGRGSGTPLHTVVAVVATNAPLEKAAVTRMAGHAEDGIARAISPSHTLYDGDTVFAVSTGAGSALRVNDPAAASRLNEIFDAGARALSRAIVRAVLCAEPVNGYTSYCERFPSACQGLEALAAWRGGGQAQAVTARALAEARRKLSLPPVPDGT
ncbi:MAG TPA: P1 family peptidase [Acidimicrobiales bacterium]|nr:P1 family peptidase [Acidimicrobiales bacterium]